jgi:uncharacterized coiled-coil DUF342 family protein
VKQKMQTIRYKVADHPQWIFPEEKDDTNTEEVSNKELKERIVKLELELFRSYSQCDKFIEMTDGLKEKVDILCEQINKNETIIKQGAKELEELKKTVDIYQERIIQTETDTAEYRLKIRKKNGLCKMLLGYLKDAQHIKLKEIVEKALNV